MARRGPSEEFGPDRCHVFESQVATEPAGAVNITPSSSCSPHLGFLRVRWLPGTTCVAPLVVVNSSSIQAFWVVSGKSGKGSDNWPSGTSTCHAPPPVCDPILVALQSERTHSAPSVSCTNLMTTGCSTSFPQSGALLSKFQMRCDLS